MVTREDLLKDFADENGNPVKWTSVDKLVERILGDVTATSDGAWTPRVSSLHGGVRILTEDGRDVLSDEKNLHLILNARKYIRWLVAAIHRREEVINELRNKSNRAIVELLNMAAEPQKAVAQELMFAINPQRKEDGT